MAARGLAPLSIGGLDTMPRITAHTWVTGPSKAPRRINTNTAHLFVNSEMRHIAPDAKLKPTAIITGIYHRSPSAKKYEYTVAQYFATIINHIANQAINVVANITALSFSKRWKETSHTRIAMMRAAIIDNSPAACHSKLVVTT